MLDVWHGDVPNTHQFDFISNCNVQTPTLDPVFILSLFMYFFGELHFFFHQIYKYSTPWWLFSVFRLIRRLVSLHGWQCLHSVTASIWGGESSSGRWPVIIAPPHLNLKISLMTLQPKAAFLCSKWNGFQFVMPGKQINNPELWCKTFITTSRTALWALNKEHWWENQKWKARWNTFFKFPPMKQGQYCPLVYLHSGFLWKITGLMWYLSILSLCTWAKVTDYGEM